MNLQKKDTNVIDAHGKLLKGKMPSSDLKLHIKIYESNKNINCIVHTHSHYATVMSILEKDLDVLSTMQADYFGAKILCLKFANHMLTITAKNE